jgi:hypothetical protein
MQQVLTNQEELKKSIALPVPISPSTDNSRAVQGDPAQANSQPSRNCTRSDDQMGSNIAPYVH